MSESCYAFGIYAGSFTVTFGTVIDSGGVEMLYSQGGLQFEVEPC